MPLQRRRGGGRHHRSVPKNLEGALLRGGGYADMDALQSRQRSSLKSVEQSACPIHIQSAEVLGDNLVRERVRKAKGRATLMVLCAR